MSQSVTIVSVYGRSVWLASELRQKGFDVTIIDLTPSLGRWSPEDREGPFGYFSSSFILASQEERITAEDYIEPVSDGFVIWTDQGPRDFKGPISKYWLQQIDPEGLQKEYITQYHKLSTSKKRDFRQKLMSMPFEKIWLSLLSHQISSTKFKENINSLEHGFPMEFYNSHFVKRPSRKSFSKIFDWCKDQGIRVIKDREIGDLRLEKNSLKVLEVKGSDRGTVTSEHFVWGLTSAETEFISTKLKEQIFGSQESKSQWYWTRFRLELSDQEIFESLPTKFTIIEDKELTWSHHNLLMLQKTETGNQIDLWLRLPTEHRFHLDYLKDLESKVIEVISKKIPVASVSVASRPQEYSYSYSELGPEVFPVFEEGFESLKSKLNNMLLDGPEQWKQFSTLGRFSIQTKILTEIQSLKEKAERKTVDTEVHAP